MKSIMKCVGKIIWFFRMFMLICKHGEEKLLKDPLTEAYSRFFLEEFGEREIKRAERHKRPLCCMQVDINDLKGINDGEGGHDAGDDALKKVVKVIKKLCRATAIIIRLGGDEFLVLLPEISKLGVKQLLKRIKEELGEDLFISTGICFWKDDMTLKELIKKADRDLYKDKKGKKIKKKKPG